MVGDAGGQCPVADQYAKLDVAVESGSGEVGGGDEDGLVVHHHCLGVQYTGGTGPIQRAGVVVDRGPGRARPIGSPEPVGETSDELVRGGGVPLYLVR